MTHREGLWTEVNIWPDPSLHPERLLTQFVGPFAAKWASDYDFWHFFWEPELRLRFRWADEDSYRLGWADLFAQLDAAIESGLIALWRQDAYSGEADQYGLAVWSQILATWQAGSDLVIALLTRRKELMEQVPDLDRGWYWKRYEHLFANQLNVPEVTACMDEAVGRLEQLWPESTQHHTEHVRQAVKEFLTESGFPSAEVGWRDRMLARSTGERLGR